MAFQYWRQRNDPRPEKTCYLAYGDAYHGDTLGSVSVGGVERFHAMFRPLLFETLRLPAPDTYRRPPGVSRRICANTTWKNWNRCWPSTIGGLPRW